jgi:hypothetical protein
VAGACRIGPGGVKVWSTADRGGPACPPTVPPDPVLLEAAQRGDRLEALERWSRDPSRDHPDDWRALRDELAATEAALVRVVPRVRDLPWHQRPAEAAEIAGLIGRARAARGRARAALLETEAARSGLIARAARVADQLAEMDAAQRRLTAGG